MAELKDKKYVVVVQCETVRQVCPGYFCERNFTQRTGGFERYGKDQPLRMTTITCGGCCGKSIHRKLAMLKRKALQHDAITPEQIVVQLSSCMTRDNYHGPRCMYAGYMKQLIARLGLDCVEDTAISKKATARREAGIYKVTPHDDAC